MLTGLWIGLLGLAAAGSLVGMRIAREAGAGRESPPSEPPLGPDPGLAERRALEAALRQARETALLARKATPASGHLERAREAHEATAATMRRIEAAQRATRTALGCGESVEAAREALGRSVRALVEAIERRGRRGRSSSLH